MSEDRAPVVIVGAGPVGVVAATLLAQRGIDSVVLERYAEPYPLPRAVHLDDEVYSILREIGLAAGFDSISRPMPGMRLVDAQHRTMAEFRRDATTPGPLGCPQASMFDQPDLERLLLANLANHPGVALRRGCTVSGVERHTDGAVVRYADESGEHRIIAGAVLGCDGANGIVRQSIGASMLDLRFCERWLVIDVNTAAPLSVWGGVHQICDPQRPATFMHITGTRYRWEFRLGPDEDAADLTTPDARPCPTTSRSSGTRPTPSAPRSPIGGAVDGSSCWATLLTRHRPSSDRVSAPACGMPTTWSGSSPACCAVSWPRASWTPTSSNVVRTPPGPCGPRLPSGGR
jgi:2-polyprenyl-6-methoxyphenol hydroxylase-like FAD-dependent oxidoreductase